MFFTIILSFFFYKRNAYFPEFRFSGPSIFSYQCIVVYFRRLLLSKWIAKKPWEMFIMHNEWWHYFMNQRIIHLVLLYKCNCIMIISLNTYNKNVDIIWHYCIISHIRLHGFWKPSALTNIRKDALKYLMNLLWYGIFPITCHINLWASRVDMACDMKNAI